MASELQLCVGDEHFNSLAIDVINKIENHFATKQSANDELSAKIETLHADYEQKCYELDKKIIETSTALEKESSNAAKLQQENAKLLEDVTKLKEENTQLQSSVHLLQTEISTLKREKDALQEEKLSIQHILQKRETELERSTSDWKAATEKLNNAINAKNEMEIKMDELQSNSMAFDYEQKKVQQEKELLEKQVQQLTEELQTVTTEASAVKLERSSELINLKGKFEEKMNECSLISINLNSLRKTNSEYQDKINDLLERNSKIQEEHASMEELYRNELQSQTKLAELYKSSADEAQAKADELSSAVSEVQRLILSSSEANAIAQQQINELDIKNTNLIRETESLKKELEKANDLLTAEKSGRSTLSEEELNELCPTAAMASKFIKSGMTLTEIYSKYIEVSDELDTVKMENKRLNEAMDAILSELNEKAPVLKQQREDYERALATISQLTSQMDNAVIECQHLQTKTDDALRKYGHSQRDNTRLRQETGDLSKQIQFLLKEISELKGGTISTDQSYNQSMQEDELSSSVITSSDAISSQLVTFRDIIDLQQQNKKLLAVVRELTEEHEKEDAARTNERVRELTSLLDETKEELSTIKEERIRQADLVEALVKQRDMYRVFLANDPNTSIPPSVLASPGLLSKSPNKSSVNTTQAGDDTVKALTSLQDEFNTYKIQNQENIKIYKEQIDKLHAEVSELRTSSAKFQAFSEFQTESSKILKQNIQDLKNENKILKDKSNQQLMVLQKQELTLVDTCDKLSNAEQAKAKVNAQLESVKSENTLLKRTEDRLRSEISFLSKEQRGQSVLLANLQKVQQTVERQEFEVRSQMRQQIESQEQELKTVRKNMNDLTDDKQQSIHAIEKQLLLVQSQYEKQCEISEETNQKLKAEVEKFQSCDLERNQLQAKLTSIEKRMKNLSDLKGMSITVDEGNTEEALKDLQTQFDALKDELATTKQKLERANNVVLQQKAIATAAEESMKQANLSNKELSDALNSRLSTANEQIVRVEQKVAKLHSDNLKLTSNKSDLINEVDRQTEGLNKQIATLQAELDDALNRLKVAQKCEQEARTELQEQALAAKEANDSYQREMILHGTDVQQLIKLKEASKSYEKKMAELKIKLQESQSQCTSFKETADNTETKYKAEIEEIKGRSDDLEKQNVVLHERIEYLSKQLSDVQQKAANIPSYLSPVKKMPTSSGDEDHKAKSDEQLMDIVKYLRKEKMLFETKFDVAATESKRLKHQVQTLETQLQTLQKKLDEERKKCETLTQKEVEHEAVVKKVETLNVLTDSNRLLRDERDRIVGELNKLSDLLEEMQKKIAPLQQENRNLTIQNNNMKTEKLALEQDVQRWQQRVQNLTQSTKRQDPEEYKKLIAENKKMLANTEQLDKELQTTKGELSTANNLVRNLETQLATQKAERTGIDTKLSAAEKDLEEKAKTINQIKRVGRRYKQLYEDLQKKTQEAEKEAATKAAESTEGAVDQKSEDSAKLNLVEASLLRANAAKMELHKQLTAANQTIEENEKKINQLKKDLEEAKQNTGTTSNEEMEILKNERDELKKAVVEKDEKGKKLLTLARNRIDQVTKELAESNNEKNQLKASENKLKNQVESAKQAEKQASDDLQAAQRRVEDLQKQLTSQHQMKLGNEARGRQIPQYSATSGPGDRKAANVRPISTTLVSQVSPLRVTRTARVMPEPQQEIVEGIANPTQEAPREPSPQTLVSTSHVSTVASVVSSVIPQSSTQPTRALVHPTRHPPRVSTATPSPSTDATVRVEGQQSEQQPSSMVAEVRRSNEVNYTAAPSSSTGPSGTSAPSENDQAIVSSSDDQTIFHEEEASSHSTNQPASTSGSDPSQQSASGGSDSAPSSSMTKIFPNRSKPLSSNQDIKLSDHSSDMTATSSDSKVAVAPVQSVQDRKRTHEDSNDDVITASSSDAQSSIPLSKRQRNSPDQSSESILESQTASSHSDSVTLQSTQPEPSTHATPEGVVEESSARIQPIRPVVEVQGEVSSNQYPATSSFQPVKVASSSTSRVATSCDITTSEEQVEESNEVENAIVISSDEDNIEMENNEAEQNEPYYGEDYQDGMLDEVSGSNQSEVVVVDQMEIAQAPISQQIRPALVINPPPPETVPRNRLSGRPAPLTPGLVPPTSVIPSDDGDGIVPCTPTLPAHTHDDNYQTINSPRVPSGPPIQFRFEDVNVPGQSSFGAPQRGIGSVVDNTIMDLGGTEEESAQTIPSLENLSSETESNIYSTRSMVSSSFGEDVEEKTSGEQEKLQEEEARECSSSEIPEPVSNLQNIRGRRIRLIKRPKGRGGNSPNSNN